MKIILMDLDGVICDSRHRAHLVPPEDKRHCNEAWHPFVAECVNDAPIPAGLEMLNALLCTIPVFIITSRQENFSQQTGQWLEGRVPGTQSPEIIYRANDDHRPPAEYKRHTLRKLVAQGYEILFAIDDDPQIVEMYQQESIATYQPFTRCASVTQATPQREDFAGHRSTETDVTAGK